MKKEIILSVVAAFFLLAGCNGKKSKSAETKKVESEVVKSDETSEEKQKEVTEVSKELTVEEVEKLNSMFVDGKLVEVDHKQILDFSYGAFGAQVRKLPWESENVYAVKDGDKIEVVAVVENKEINKAFVQVVIPTGEKGYMEYGEKSPYSDGMFSVVESAEIDGKQVDFLKYDGHQFEISYNALMKTLPDKNSETLIEFTKEHGFDYWPTSLITADYKWVKIKYKETEGWVEAKYLSAGRGGPILETPEEMIYFQFIEGNLI